MFKFFVIAIVTLFSVATWQGWEVGAGKRGLMPKEAHQQPGGYRSYHFWRGGK